MLAPVQSVHQFAQYIVNACFISVCKYAYVYGIRAVFILVLATIARFRREMSCNRVYLEDVNNDTNNNGQGEGQKGLIGENNDGDTQQQQSQQQEFGDEASDNSNANTNVPTNQQGITPNNKSEETKLLSNNDSIHPSHQISLSAFTLDSMIQRLLFQKSEQQPQPHATKSISNSTSSTSPQSNVSSTINPSGEPGFYINLPSDIQIKFLSYLHPRDVLTFSTIDKKTQSLIHGPIMHGGYTQQSTNTTTTTILNSNTMGVSDLIWLELWKRDYGWILKDWKIGQQAVQRSLQYSPYCTTYYSSILAYIGAQHPSESSSSSSTTTTGPSSTNYNNNNTTTTTTPPTSMKEFYFYFSQTWLNYTIAGHATTTSCLTGLHGHVFDISNFVEQHPGSPETLLMQGGGRDSTHFFESIGHSSVARRLAVNTEFVEVIDLSCVYSSSSSRSSSSSSGSKKSFGVVPSNVFLQKNSKGIDTSMLGPTATTRSRRSSSISSTTSTTSDNSSSSTTTNTSSSNTPTTETEIALLSNLLPKIRSKPRSPGCVYYIRQRLDSQRRIAERKSRRIMNLLGNTMVYYDPLCHCWKAWYLDLDFKPTYVHSL